jgi:hypothetical protein
MIQWVLGAVSLGVKLTTHLHLVPRLKNAWSYTSIPQYAFIAWCSVKAQGQLLFNDTCSVGDRPANNDRNGVTGTRFEVEVIAFM